MCEMLCAFLLAVLLLGGITVVGGYFGIEYAHLTVKLLTHTP